jgi:hypothetical protein
LVTNGTFDTDTDWTKGTGWTISGGAANHAAGTGSDIEQAGVLVVGRRYKLSVDVTVVNVTGPIYVYDGSYTAIAANAAVGSYEIEFTAATTDLRFRAGGPFDGSVDNISVITLDHDRSVNNNGLIVNGTVTRTPVATGADLVAYSGFSASNYLEQPYNSDLDFGTGDFCVMGWVKASAVSGTLFARSNGAVASARFSVSVNSSGYPQFFISDGSTSQTAAGTTSIVNSGWRFIVAVRNSTNSTLQLYLDSVSIASPALTASGSMAPDDQFVRVGYNSNSTNALTGSLALFRISATAPTAEQIAKIYEDEKVLFQEGAQATLYGASDSVTALAHDSDTGLLHVGTSAGRSVFQGLRRVSNTTTAVGTAISAANNLIVEE